MSEDLPQAESRVTLKGDEIVLDWRRSNWEAHLRLVKTLKRALRRAGFPVLLSKPFDRSTPSHQCGTARMGEDPATSVTDAFGRCHDHPNLWICDASLLPTSAAVNPSLTIAALALRQADRLKEEVTAMTPTALVTGGQQGIGRGIAEALHGAGWQVALVAEQPGDAPAVQEALSAMPGASYHRHDLADIAAIPALLDAVGPVTTLVSNAGVPAMARGDLLDMTPESYDRCMAVNLRGAVFLAQAVARGMLALPEAPYRSIASSPRSAPRWSRPTGRNTASPRRGRR